MANKNSRLFEYVALVCAFVAASPVVYFLVEGLVSSPQLRDAVVILVTVCLLFAIEGGIKPRRPEFSTSAFVALALSISTLFLANFAKKLPLTCPSYNQNGRGFPIMHPTPFFCTLTVLHFRAVCVP